MVMDGMGHILFNIAFMKHFQFFFLAIF